MRTPGKNRTATQSPKETESPDWSGSTAAMNGTPMEAGGKSGKAKAEVSAGALVGIIIVCVVVGAAVVFIVMKVVQQSAAGPVDPSGYTDAMQ
jgi:hypothetical protein